MLALEVVCIARSTLAVLTERGESTDGSIVVMSSKFGLEMGRQLCAEEGGSAEPGEISGVAVVYKDDVEEPALITVAGKVYPLLPEWARSIKGAAAATNLVLRPVI